MFQDLTIVRRIFIQSKAYFQNRSTTKDLSIIDFDLKPQRINVDRYSSQLNSSHLHLLMPLDRRFFLSTTQHSKAEITIHELKSERDYMILGPKKIPKNTQSTPSFLLYIYI